MLTWVAILLFVHTAISAKRELFKSCAESGFCHRNRHYAHEVAKLGDTFESPYFVLSDSIDCNQLSCTGQIVKQLKNSQIMLPFEVVILEESFRLRIDELRSDTHFHKLNSCRFSAANLSMMHGSATSSKISSTINDKSLQIFFNDSSATINFKPFKITIFYKGKPQVILNDNNLFNIEHHRKEEENSMFEFESDYDLFHDSFKDSRADSLPLGPESIGLDIKLLNMSHVYGIPEHSDRLSLEDTSQSDPYRLYNVDIFEYEPYSKLPMYGSIPFLIGLNSEISTGVFWVNSADTWVDINKKKDTHTHWISENGILDLVIIVRQNPKEVSTVYSSLTGRVQLPSQFSLGYHQCRWNYNSEDDVRDVHSKMDKYGIPYDTIWLDIEYTDEKKYFTWKRELFPDPSGLLQELDETKRSLVAIIDPHIKVGYEVSDYLESNGLVVKEKDFDTPYHGHCWPGESVWIDTFNPNAQSYWDTLFCKGSDFAGSSSNLHVWNDMNEPSVFNGPETTFPKDLVHFGKWEHRSIHNWYGKSFHEATYYALINRSPNHRPFVLTRSYAPGSQATAAMWTGDNAATWEYLKVALPMILSNGIAGMPFAGADVGGFFGNPSKELLTRWYQSGIWYPFFRAHAHIDSRRREPWIAGEPYTTIIRDTVRLRYQLLPVLYTAFYESSKLGYPVLRPLFYEIPENQKLYDIDDQFFVGSSGLMVKPVTEEGATTDSIYLPDPQIYYDFFKLGTTLQGEGIHELEVDLTTIPVLARGGSIITQKLRYRRSSQLMKHDPYTLMVFLDSEGIAKGKLYIDDGTSFNYRLGHFLEISFQYSNNILSSELKANIARKFQDSLDDVLVERVIIIGLPDDFTSVKAKVTQGEKTWISNWTKENGYLVVKNPRVSISQNWEINIEV
ncbi:hypothetical protein LJB42_001452 [Komagataella kurtzmanii]|nr:hypothetical protein LJB42_001452 [Komagataella kurtzmanii]